MNDDYTRHYRTPDGTLLRLKVEHDPDAMNPREWPSTAILVTDESGFCSPDKATDLPEAVQRAWQEWAARDHVDAYRIARYARMFAPSVVFIGGLYRGASDELWLDTDPSNATRYHGLAVITGHAWRDAMGPTPPDGSPTPAEVAEQEVTRYRAWAEGDACGFVIERPAFPGADIDADAEVVDSCWGFIAEADYALQRGVESLPDGTEGIELDEFDHENGTALVLTDGTRYDGRLQYDGNGRPVMDWTTDGACGFRWNDALMTSLTPAPSARCPNEYNHDEPDAEDDAEDDTRDAIEAAHVRTHDDGCPCYADHDGTA